ncbi:flagellar filament capping protein FliD [Spirilliplanes yamanashiensis]|uniref:Flagellar hook-associated protein 2 n=1 Tax=Spirilliplanes yamanashiensis TaxID=42233 RepID=A0A8J4DI43_9ACTN|nr:flagellar filament capping protein FliD [Spirilliplanes yamanashiensis]MDP9814371.1 flagellar hook-associated protein 2 [Spirilliplanes yamanashiensis]GIJ02024.1 flagellar hook-associated protein 2 [Spirilliplanes yamanashiensis]
MTSTIDGLVSGLSTSALISSLMQVEAAPQNLLKSKVTKQQTALTAYQGLNTKLAALETAAQNMQKLSTWRSVAPSSTSTSVTASATSSNSNQTGSVTFDVTQLATTQVSTVDAASPTTQIVKNNVQNLTVTVGGVATQVDVSADRTITGVAAAINNSGTGVKATLVTDSAGKTIMQLTGPKAGAANSFTITGLDTGYAMAPITAAADAKIKVGGATAGAYEVSSPTNTFTNLIQGTSITVSKVESGVTVGAETDVAAISNMMKALVEAANSALSEVKTKSASSTSTTGGKTTVTGGPLSGDYMVKQVADKILSSVSTGLDGYGSLSKFGVQLSRDGKLTFDEAKFKSAYTADPAALKTAASGFAAKVEKIADDQQTNVTNVVTSRTSVIKTLNDQISAWDIRLSSRQAALQKQFASLETSMGKMQSQSQWLAGQISSLG